MSLIKTRTRVADHGEVFTPAWMVEAMLDLVNARIERIDPRHVVRMMQRMLSGIEQLADSPMEVGR